MIVAGLSGLMPGPSGMPNNVDSFGKLTICDCFWAETINQQCYLLLLLLYKTSTFVALTFRARARAL